MDVQAYAFILCLQLQFFSHQTICTNHKVSNKHWVEPSAPLHQVIILQIQTSDILWAEKETLAQSCDDGIYWASLAVFFCLRAPMALIN